jgi:hypothetical protein
VFGIGWMAYLLLAVGFAVIVFAVFAPSRPRSSEAEMSPCEADVEERRRASWPALIDGTQADLPLPSRLRMIESLGAAAQDWCGPILVSAFVEEEPSARAAVLAALREARYQDCADVVASALHSVNLGERVLGIELADAIDAVPLLDAALADADFVVALAAAYALGARMNGSFSSHLRAVVPQDRARELERALQVFM